MARPSLAQAGGLSTTPSAAASLATATAAPASATTAGGGGPTSLAPWVAGSSEQPMPSLPLGAGSSTAAFGSRLTSTTAHSHGDASLGWAFGSLAPPATQARPAAGTSLGTAQPLLDAAQAAPSKLLMHPSPFELTSSGLPAQPAPAAPAAPMVAGVAAGSSSRPGYSGKMGEPPRSPPTLDPGTSLPATTASQQWQAAGLQAAAAASAVRRRGMGDRGTAGMQPSAQRLPMRDNSSMNVLPAQSGVAELAVPERLSVTEQHHEQARKQAAALAGELLRGRWGTGGVQMQGRMQEGKPHTTLALDCLHCCLNTPPKTPAPGRSRQAL